jgi:hypothetical protein
MTRFKEEEFEIAGFVFKLDLGTVFEGFGDGAAGTIKLEDCSPVGALNCFETSEEGVFYTALARGGEGIGRRGGPSSFVHGRRTWFPSLRGRGVCVGFPLGVEGGGIPEAELPIVDPAGPTAEAGILVCIFAFS